MKPSHLTKRIEELSEKLKPVASEGIRIDFNSFTEPEQLVLALDGVPKKLAAMVKERPRRLPS
jgi:hypothetical protein